VYQTPVKEGLPDCILYTGHPDFEGALFFGMLDGDDLSKFKFGIERDCKPQDFMKILAKIVPSVPATITSMTPCYYQITQDSEFKFEKVGDIIYAYGFNGRGFKFMPYHGKRIYEGLVGNERGFNKYKKDPEVTRL